MILEFDADANDDGIVDGTDFLQWQAGFGKNDATSVADGDFNYDGQVDDGDLAVWETQYGAPPPLAASSASVPEPSAMLLILFGSLFCLASRHGLKV